MTNPGQPRVIYTDLDGTLLGKGGSLFRTAAGEFTLAGAEGLRVCSERGVRLCLCSGRSIKQLDDDARLLGADSFIAEAGCVLVRDRGDTLVLNCAPFGEKEGFTVFEEIGSTGAPELLFQHFGETLAYHAPWHRDHGYSHLMRGQIDTAVVDELLAGQGLNELKVVDNGIIEDRGYGMPVDELHAYHLIPRQAGKGSAIRLDLELSGISPREAVACGDSSQDLEMAAAVRRLYLMANAADNHSGLIKVLPGYENVELLAASMVEGFREAVRLELENGAGDNP
ncbi:MAG: HAD family hydrolase [Thermoleophilia bacterium]